MNTELLQASWARVAVAGEVAARHFYATLFVLAPEVREIFPVSMSAQNDKLLTALGHVVCHVDEPGVLGGFLGRLGADHRRFQVQPAHYHVVGQALLSTLEQLHGPDWTPQLRGEWTQAYRVVAQLMQAGAADAQDSTPPWWTATVTTVCRPNAEVVVFTATANPAIPYRAGQSVPVHSSRAQGWRYLSPATAPRPDGSTEFHLRAVGGISTATVQRLTTGDELRIGMPIGSALVGHADGVRPLLLVAGGTGLAPLRAVLDEIAGQDRHRPTTLVYAATTPIGLYDHARVSALAAVSPWLTYLPTVRLGRWRGPRGTAVEVALSTPHWLDSDVLVCGSPRMVTGTRSTLLAHGVPQRRVYADEYSTLHYPPLVDASVGGYR